MKLYWECCIRDHFVTSYIVRKKSLLWRFNQFLPMFTEGTPRGPAISKWLKISILTEVTSLQLRGLSPFKCCSTRGPTPWIRTCSGTWAALPGGGSCLPFVTSIAPPGGTLAGLLGGPLLFESIFDKIEMSLKAKHEHDWPQNDPTYSFLDLLVSRESPTSGGITNTRRTIKTLSTWITPGTDNTLRTFFPVHSPVTSPRWTRAT